MQNLAVNASEENTLAVCVWAFHTCGNLLIVVFQIALAGRPATVWLVTGPAVQIISVTKETCAYSSRSEALQQSEYSRGPQYL